MLRADAYCGRDTLFWLQMLVLYHPLWTSSSSLLGCDFISVACHLRKPYGSHSFWCQLIHVNQKSISRSNTVLKPVPGSGSRAKCAQFRGSSDAKHVSSWFQPWATLWPTCHMLVPASLLQSVECSTECKNSIFHCTIGCNKYK